MEVKDLSEARLHEFNGNLMMPRKTNLNFFKGHYFTVAIFLISPSDIYIFI